jgi:hypothetical protein
MTLYKHLNKRIKKLKKHIRQKTRGIATTTPKIKLQSEYNKNILTKSINGPFVFFQFCGDFQRPARHRHVL